MAHCSFFVRELKGRPGGEICLMGGGALAAALLDAGVVDEVGLNVHPVLLGAGIPMFRQMTTQIDLQLLETKTLAGGCIYVRYRVVCSP